MSGSMKVVPGTIALQATLAGFFFLATASANAETGEGPITGNTIESVLEQHTDRLMSFPGVVGTAIGECMGRPCIHVLVLKQTPDLSRQVPPMLEGFPVVIVETGEIRALDPE
jgi:hypothetical protein